MSLLPGYIHAKENINDKFISAITESDVVVVERFLKRMGSELTQKDKNELLDAARETVDECQQSVSLRQSRWDLAKFFVGVPLSGVGVYLGSRTVEAFMDKKRDVAFLMALISSIALIPGLYLTVKGWQCSTASERLKAAERVEELIDAKVVGETR